MSLRSRKTQHLPKKETKDLRLSELNDLRRENQKLKREVAKLRREVEKTIHLDKTPPDDGWSPGHDTEFTKKSEPVCPECGSSQLEQVQLNKVFTICKKCKWRKST